MTLQSHENDKDSGETEVEIQFTKRFYEARKTANSNRNSLREHALRFRKNAYILRRNLSAFFTACVSFVPRAEWMFCLSPADECTQVSHQDLFSGWLTTTKHTRLGTLPCLRRTNVKIKHCGWFPPLPENEAHTHAHTRAAELPNPHYNVLQLVCVLFDDDLFCPRGSARLHDDFVPLTSSHNPPSSGCGSHRLVPQRV